MSIPSLPEHLACLRDDARRIVECARSHEDDLNGLLRTTQDAVRQATELSRAFAEGNRTATHLQRLCYDQLSESVENAGRHRRSADLHQSQETADC